MAMRKGNKGTKTSSSPPPSSSTAVSPSTSISKPMRSTSVSTGPPVSTEKNRPPPLSWKDAVQRAPAKPQPPSKPAKTNDSSTKLAAKSRSVSRIVQSASFKKHSDLFPTGVAAEPASSGDVGKSRTTPTATVPHTKTTAAKPTKKTATAKQVSFSTDESCKPSSNSSSTASKKTKTRSESDSHRFADLVKRLGLNDTQLMLAQSYRSKKAQAPCGSRPRSASADTVLLHRGSPPLWVLAESPVTLEELHYSRDAKQWSRKHRAMSVPNAAATGAIHSLSVEKSSKPQEEESRAKRIPQQPAPAPSPAVTRAPSEEDSSELDYGCEDTHSESTSDSSCTSPRHTAVTHHFTEHSPVSLDVLHEHEHRVSGDEMDDFSDYMTPEDEEEDYEAYQLLDRINSLAAEFKAHRTYEESSALAWSVQHAARQGAISPQLQQNLLSSIRNGAWEEARDVLYHKCHLVPAVGSVAEPATSSSVDPAIEASFEQCIDTLSPTDSSDARLQKLRVLKILSDLLTTWVKLVGYERGLTEEHIALTSGSLFLAGSYRLGLNDPLSDIDAVCVVPWHVTHEDFFSSFCAMLEQTSGVTHLAPVPNAYVPLISLSFMDVSMDLLFARLPMTGVETHQEIDSDHILVNVDPTSMKSLNAPRVSSMLLCLVPRRRVFRIVLRAVRAWARRRGVYSSKLGYLGGISWSILVAFVCQMYPDAEPSKLFVRFFQVFSEWQWPRPVMLNMVYDAGLGFEMWDPRQNLYDRSHIMPIVTPAYPHMNSAVQVSQSTFSVIYEELWRARYLAEAADGIARSIGAAAVAVADSSSQVVGASEPLGGAPSGLYVETTSSPTMTQAVASAAAVSGAQFEWDKLFQRSNFFIRYDSYLVVDFHAETSASMHVWGKFVHSRLRKLVDSLQHLSAVARVHAFPLYFPTTSTGHAPGSCMVIGMEFQSRSRTNSDMHGLAARVDPEVQANLDRTIRFFLATDLQQLAERKQDMVAEARLLTWGELPEFVFEHGRPAAMVERAEYHEDMEHMMLQSHGGQYRSPYSGGGSGDRYGSGKWRSPNGNHSRLRSGSGSGSRYFGSKGGKQSRGNGGGGGQKPYYMAQGG